MQQQDRSKDPGGGVKRRSTMERKRCRKFCSWRSALEGEGQDVVIVLRDNWLVVVKFNAKLFFESAVTD